MNSLATPARSLRETAVTSILIADDQPSNIEVVGSVLGKLGFEIIPASDGPTVLKRLSHRVVDLILLDLLMPGMDGCEVCRRIRENPEWQDIPVIFLSAADEKDLIVRALDSGGMDYITKPFNHAELVSRVRTQLDLKSARDRLKQLAEDKDELIGILTHDLKNHLGGMQMSANLLRDRLAKQGDKNQAQLCENICHSTGQLLSFVKEFLANSAADRSLSFKPQTLNLSDAVNRTVQEYREAAGRKNLEIRVSLPEGESIVLADRRALGQILDNLLSNALKFSPSGKRVDVIVRTSGDCQECVVRDQGPGFTAEDQKRMFRRYGRLSARPTGGEPSTGLGLSIVKKLVQELDGELICESTPGQGASFTLRLRSPSASPDPSIAKTKPG
jgi:two-component system sensor histidine kinase/response regulator